VVGVAVDPGGQRHVAADEQVGEDIHAGDDGTTSPGSEGRILLTSWSRRSCRAELAGTTDDSPRREGRRGAGGTPGGSGSHWTVRPRVPCPARSSRRAAVPRPAPCGVP